MSLQDSRTQEITDTLNAFMRDYEDANNQRDIHRLRAMISDDASYWFSDGSYEGIEPIVAAIERTFTAIQDELYQIDDLRWVAMEPSLAVCRYRFTWRGTIKGKSAKGEGRGTNVLAVVDSPANIRWKIVHEHLSPIVNR